MSELTEQAVLEALREVSDPELDASLVDLGMVKEIKIEDNHVTVLLVLTAPDCPMANWIEYQVRRAVGRLPGVVGVRVDVLDEPYQPPGSSDDLQSWVDDAWGRR